VRFNGNEIFITVTNPVDVLNTFFSRELDLPLKQVVALGGMLDAARFRSTVTEHIQHTFGFQLEPVDVKNAFVFGQHGDCLTPIYEQLDLLRGVSKLTASDISCIDKKMNEIVPRLIQTRGYADFAPSTHVFHMVERFLQDSDSNIECCSLIPPKHFQMQYCGEILNVSFGVPVVLGRDGALTVSVDISEESKRRIKKGAEAIQDYVNMLYSRFNLSKKRR
jgi:malate dehydrogenase